MMEPQYYNTRILRLHFPVFYIFDQCKHKSYNVILDSNTATLYEGLMSFYLSSPLQKTSLESWKTELGFNLGLTV